METTDRIRIFYEMQLKKLLQRVAVHDDSWWRYDHTIKNFRPIETTIRAGFENNPYPTSDTAA
jgi:hypothetical protein